MIWITLLVASVACYAIKLAGLSLPQRFLEARYLCPQDS